jgi:Protein of unknown function (DUF3025)
LAAYPLWPALSLASNSERLSLLNKAAESEQLAQRFAASTSALGALAYEQSIAQTGQIPTRLDNPHDLFNALVWLRFPQTKTKLNQLHVNAPQQGTQRSRLRDGLTLFDETGILLLLDPKQLADFKAAHLAHDWQRVYQGYAWHSAVKPIVFGHGGLHTILNGAHENFTLKALVLPQSDQVDQDLALWFSGHVNEQLPKAFLPLPFAGVPTWWPANETASFYQRTDIFRPSRKAL